MKAKNLRSNLGFVSNFELEIEKIENGYKLKFSTGFECDAVFLKKVEEINIYSYKSKYGGETNYLHERKVGNIIYFQTVQDGLSPGGSTFQLDKL